MRGARFEFVPLQQREVTTLGTMREGRNLRKLLLRLPIPNLTYCRPSIPPRLPSAS
jgi:hypothetical protein